MKVIRELISMEMLMRFLARIGFNNVSKRFCFRQVGCVIFVGQGNKRFKRIVN